jgi:hypothetical protein
VMISNGLTGTERVVRLGTVDLAEGTLVDVVR